MSLQPYDLPEECQSIPNMEEWLKGAGLNCEPCVFSVAVPWYVEALQEQGEAEKASAFSQLATRSGSTPLKLAQEMDRIKASVSPGLATYLKELDCTVQFNAADLAK